MTARALLVGVSESRARPGLATLPGVVGDIAQLRATLLLRGFGEQNIDVPAGDRLSKWEVQRSLLKLAQATVDGDIAIFFFSGHGYRVIDGSGDEPDDKWDECLACADELLVDDWFRDEFWPATQTGSRWVTCVDACHSATATMGVDVFRDGNPDVQDEPIAVGGARYRLALSACGEGEKALERRDGDGYGLARGVMTATMLRSIDEEPDVTYSRLWQLVQARAAAVRNSVWWIGTPAIWSSGPDDSLRHLVAFRGDIRP